MDDPRVEGLLEAAAESYRVALSGIMNYAVYPDPVALDDYELRLQWCVGSTRPQYFAALQAVLDEVDRLVARSKPNQHDESMDDFPTLELLRVAHRNLVAVQAGRPPRRKQSRWWKS